MNEPFKCWICGMAFTEEQIEVAMKFYNPPKIFKTVPLGSDALRKWALAKMMRDHRLYCSLRAAAVKEEP